MGLPAFYTVVMQSLSLDSSGCERLILYCIVQWENDWTEPDVFEEMPDTLTILHVEDELLLRLATGQTLNELGFEIVEAATAEDAMREIAAHNGNFAAAIVDLGLPDRDGTTLVPALREGRKGMPIVIASGALPPDLSEWVAAGARVHHLAKPYAADDLLAALLALGIRPPR